MKRRITAKDWTFIGIYNHAAKWCRHLCSYYLEKPDAKKFKRVQSFNWIMYSILFIPVHLLQAIVLLWDGGLKEFTLLNRELGYDILVKGTGAFERAELVWNKVNKTRKGINN